MGRPMVARLVAAGHDVRVLGRSDEKRSAIAQLGADAVADIAGFLSGSPVRVLNNPDETSK